MSYEVRVDSAGQCDGDAGELTLTVIVRGSGDIALLLAELERLPGAAQAAMAAVKPLRGIEGGEELEARDLGDLRVDGGERCLPAWRDLSIGDRAAVIVFLHTMRREGPRVAWESHRPVFVQDSPLRAVTDPSDLQRVYGGEVPGRDTYMTWDPDPQRESAAV